MIAVDLFRHHAMVAAAAQVVLFYDMFLPPPPPLGPLELSNTTDYNTKQCQCMHACTPYGYGEVKQHKVTRFDTYVRIVLYVLYVN